MISKVELKRYIEIGKKIVVVEDAGIDQTNIAACLFRLTGDGFEIEAKEEFDSLGALKESTLLKYPLVLGITSQQVLTKKLPSYKKSEADIALAFSNINKEEFGIERLYTNSQCFVSICRKKIILELIENYESIGAKVISFFLGSAYLSNLVDILPYAEMYSKTVKLETQEGEIKFVPNKEGISETYQLGDENINSAHILSIALGLQFLNNQTEVYSNVQDFKKQLFSKTIQSRYYKALASAMLSVLVVALLINSWVFSSIFQKVEQLQENQQLYETQKELISNMQQSIEKKSKLINSIQQTGFSNSSQLINEIIEPIPASILLKSVVYQPLKKVVRLNKYIQQNKGEITVSGRTNDKKEFFKWTENIENSEFLEQLIIEEFEDLSLESADFNISLQIVDK